MGIILAIIALMLSWNFYKGINIFYVGMLITLFMGIAHIEAKLEKIETNLQKIMEQNEITKLIQ